MVFNKAYKYGFALIELIAVLIILSTISAIAISIFKSKSYEAKQIAHNENIRVLKRQAQAYLLEQENIKKDKNLIPELIESGYIKEKFKNPLSTNAEDEYRVVVSGVTNKVTVWPETVEVTGSIEKNSYRKKLVSDAGGVLYLDARNVTAGRLPTNMPFDSQWMELTQNNNNVTLNNFSETSTSGWSALNSIDIKLVNLIGDKGDCELDANSNNVADGLISGHIIENTASISNDSITGKHSQKTFGNNNYSRTFAKYDATRAGTYYMYFFAKGLNANTCYGMLNVNETVDKFQDAVYVINSVNAPDWKLYSKIVNLNSGDYAAWGIYAHSLGGEVLSDCYGIFDITGVNATKAQLDLIVSGRVRKYGYINNENCFTYPSLVFDGTNDYGGLINNASIDIITAPIGVFATVKADATEGYVFAKNGDNSDQNQYALYYSANGEYEAFIRGARRGKTNVVQQGKFYNVGFYWDGSTVKLYVNQIHEGTDEIFSGNLISRENVNIGCRSGSADGSIRTRFFKGSIATLTIYNGSDINKILKAEREISRAYIE